MKIPFTKLSVLSPFPGLSSLKLRRRPAGARHSTQITPPHPFRRWLFKLPLFVAAAGALALLAGTLWFIADLPSPTKLRSADNLAVSSQIFDRHGTLLYEIFADENRTPVALNTLPDHLVQATIAIEDKNFRQHFGLDFLGIARALIRNLQGSSGVQGGSTITQQLIKVSLLTNERTLERKVKEAILTIATEILYSKDDILEMYLNHIPYGGTAWGIEAAAQTYFDKPAHDLNLAEAAYLAGLPQSPTRYSPFGNTPELGRERQKEVLRRMVEEKYITPAQADEAANQPLKFAEKRFDIKAPHFVFYVRDQLVEQYGEAAVQKGGFRVTTTLDYGLQEVIQASVAAEIDQLRRYRVGNGAAVVTKPQTGEILAMVGSHDYFDATSEGQINMTVRPRQPGSSIKPINLAVALQLRRATLGSMLLDIPTCFQQIGQSDYCPKNYDGSYRGPLLMREALANSYNIPAVKLGIMNSIDNFIATASAMGLNTFGESKNYGPSIALGAGEVTMVDMATAFGTLANQGVKVPAFSILKIEDYTGKTLYEMDLGKRQQAVAAQQFLQDNSPATERPLPPARQSTNVAEVYRALDPEVAYLVNDVMSDNTARASAFGTNSQLAIRGKKVAAKTGTTNDLRDNWTVGFTPEYVSVVWVGNTDNKPMSAVVSGVTGAAPIWNDIMSYLLRDTATVAWPEPPETIITAPVCRETGAMPAGEGSCTVISEKFWQGTEPQVSVPTKIGTWIVGQTGLPPREGDPTDQLRFEERFLLTDPFTRNYCLDCTRQMVDVPKEDGTVEKKPVPESYVVPAERLYQVNSGYWGWE